MNNFKVTICRNENNLEITDEIKYIIKIHVTCF